VEQREPNRTKRKPPEGGERRSIAIENLRVEDPSVLRKGE